MASTAWQPAYWRLWSASTAANVGDGIRAAAFPLVVVTFTRDPLAVGGLTVAAHLPWLVFGLIGGAVVDRVDRRRLGWTVNAFRAAALGALVMGLAADVATLWWLYVVAFVVGIGETLADNAVLALVPSLVPSQQLERANGRLVSAQVAGNEFVGPLLGSVLFSMALLLPVAVDGLALGLGAVLLLSLPTRPTPTAAAARGVRVRDSIAEGLRFVRRQPRLRLVVAIGATVSVVDAAWFSRLVLIAEQRLGLPPGGFGLLLAIGAVGGIVGGAVAGRVLGRFGNGSTTAVTLAATAAAQLGIAASTSTPVVGAMLAVSSGAFALWNTVSVTERQRLTPDAMLGRVNAAYRTAAIGAAPVGAILGGALARGIGLTAPLLLGVVPLLVLAFVAGRRLSQTTSRGRA